MKTTEQISLSKTFKLIRDLHARNVGEWILGERDIVIVGSAWELWVWARSIGGLFSRVAYRCKSDGKRRDIQGRQGVHNSAQDGTVAGTGAPMAKEGYSLSFWTDVQKDIESLEAGGVNTGAGLGFRTLLTEGLLCIRVGNTDYLTLEGQRTLRRKGHID